MASTLRHKTSKKLSIGKHYPLGATPAEGGVNFAIFSRHAQEVFLLLFDRPASEPVDVISIENCTRFVWHVFVEGVTAGQLYGYKIRGPHDPGRGLRFNEQKLLMDPYARALTGKFRNINNRLLAYDPAAPEHDLSLDRRDNTRLVPKSIVIDSSFDWQGDAHPDRSLQELIIYEAHLRGFTMHPSSGVHYPGTFLGFIEKIPYLTELGINAVEFLPLHEFYVEDFLVERGLTNYWGYNTIGFFIPESSYSTGRFPGCQVQEFKTMVRELHRAGIEVILDVVYNHTGEGNELGPTVCFRGIDNPTYYCLTGDDAQPARRYVNYTGCGNSLNVANPYCMRLVMDSLRYWVQEMHVDGFRFDLATALGREAGRFEKSASFFDAICQDPVLNRVKMIAEPWDIETYQVGNFPVDWSEWNGKFRDTMRRFIRGDAGQLKDLGCRLTGSADLYGDDGRHPYNSINFITCHDGFTLRDLVSYNQKHNEANAEDNKDGNFDNASWNCGVEGERENAAIGQLRKQQIKNFMCCLFFSAGTPMLLAGDECMRTQQGNNNAYCQDNEISWLNWDWARRHADILDFCRKAIAFRKQYPVLQRGRFFLGRDLDGHNVPDIVWFGADLQRPAWDDPEQRTICYQLDGREAAIAPADYLLFVILNAAAEARPVRLPQPEGKAWFRIVDTSLLSGEDFLAPGQETRSRIKGSYPVSARSVVVLLGRPVGPQRT